MNSLFLQALVEEFSEENCLDGEPFAQLNVMWVEWLIGWPLGWTDLKPLEMGKFQQWQCEHLICSHGATEE